MESLFPGYNYDIFISYRQKDNKGDRWVSEFVEALKTELESTFKEEISVYFDINPHDGLLETHDVDESLKDKLKCLVFIPIISRTYCDPKSFAWEHEFKAFVELASKDQFGLKVKLPNGNVANRVLPVQIHDLKSEDKALVEKELGGFIRAIEFIYKESGVNRPLTPKDSEDKNTNKTNYRNQINKVANAIDEIISALKTEPVPVVKEKTLHREPLEEVKKEERKEEKEKSTKIPKSRLLSGITILVVLIFAAVITYPKIFKRDTLEKLRSSGERISIAVMPFQNMTNDTIWNIWQDGMQNELIISLTNSEELKVRQSESVNTLIQNKGFTNYTSMTPSIASAISKRLDANIFVFGSIKQVSQKIRINAQLIDSKTVDSFKSFQIDGAADKILDLTDSLSNQIKNYLIVSVLGKEVTRDFQQLASTRSPEAYRLFITADKFYTKTEYPTAAKLLTQAITIDSNFAMAACQLALSYGHIGLTDQYKKWLLYANRKRDQMSLQQSIYLDYLSSTTSEEFNKSLNQLLEIDDQVAFVHFQLGLHYSGLQQYEKVISELEKTIELYHKYGSKPRWPSTYTMLLDAYYKTGQYKKVKKTFLKAKKDYPDDRWMIQMLIRSKAIFALTEGDIKDAGDYIDKYISTLKGISASEAYIVTNLAGIYSEADILDKAEEYYRQALSFEPEKPNRQNNLAYFLIDKDRNINEGMELVDKALELSPDNYNYLHTKGWGLYKQGKFKEALEFIQKADSIKLFYNHTIYLHLEAAKKAVAGQKAN